MRCSPVVLLALAGGFVCGQSGQSPASAITQPPATSTADIAVSRKDRRKAEQLYLEATKLFAAQIFEQARIDFERAATLDSANSDYKPAALLARSHEVTQLIQQAAKARMHSDVAEEQAALRKALELDPANPQLAEHLNELTSDAMAPQAQPLYQQSLSTLGQADQLVPAQHKQTLHLKTNARDLIQKVFDAYGVQANVDSSVPATPARFDIDDASFADAAHALGLVTDTFWVPLDAKRVLVAKDTPGNREQFEPLEMETVSLQGMSTDEMTEVSNLAKNVFQIKQVPLEQNTGTLTVRTSSRTMDAFNTTLRSLQDGRSQVVLDVRLVELAHTFDR
ncbi:MAG: hypothetical protein KGL64_03995, partial [Acidobacteriota bacterium]|nr:hypothetical protein [Acidobacteriota bacterium]